MIAKWRLCGATSKMLALDRWWLTSAMKQRINRLWTAWCTNQQDIRHSSKKQERGGVTWKIKCPGDFQRLGQIVVDSLLLLIISRNLSESVRDLFLRRHPSYSSKFYTAVKDEVTFQHSSSPTLNLLAGHVKLSFFPHLDISVFNITQSHSRARWMKSYSYWQWIRLIQVIQQFSETQ